MERYIGKTGRRQIGRYIHTYTHACRHGVPSLSESL